MSERISSKSTVSSIRESLAFSLSLSLFAWFAPRNILFMLLVFPSRGGHQTQASLVARRFTRFEPPFARQSTSVGKRDERQGKECFLPKDEPEFRGYLRNDREFILRFHVSTGDNRRMKEFHFREMCDVLRRVQPLDKSILFEVT